MVVSRLPGRGVGTASRRGVALIAILMLFAVASTIAIEVVHRQDYSRTRTINLLSWDKRYQYAIAAETVAIQGLIDDLEQDNSKNELLDDCEKEQWAVALPPTPYGDAILTASVQDLQARFNINWLVVDNAGQFERVPERRDQFSVLLQSLLSDSNLAQVLADEMADWLDSDNIVNGTQGAEDADYRLRRTPNMPVLHESEIRALRSFSLSAVEKPDFYQFLTALPESSKLNVNTASRLVLEAVLSATGGSGAASAIISGRESSPFKTVDDVLALPALSGLQPAQRQALEALLDVRSEYFQVIVDIEADEGTSRLVTRIKRPAQGRTAVYSRAIMPILGPLEPRCNPDYNQTSGSAQGGTQGGSSGGGAGGSSLGTSGSLLQGGAQGGQ